MVLDGIDGPVARAWAVRETVPRIDGYALDLIIDYVTCIVVPVLFLHRFECATGWSLYVGAFMLFTSALWMARTDQMTEDHFFNGFPCEWNMIVPTLYLLDVSTVVRRSRRASSWPYPADQHQVPAPDAGAAVAAGDDLGDRAVVGRRCCT